MVMDVSVSPDIGGNHGYPRVVTEAEADTVVTTADGLVTAMGNATSGEVIFMPGDAQIDLSAYNNIDFGASGCTLASDRGYQGSNGAYLHADNYLSSHPDSLFAINQNDCRLTGFQLEGPEQHHIPYDSSKRAGGIWLKGGNNGEADNIHITGFPLAAFKVAGSSYPNNTYHIHHCHIHDNAMEGLGYGMELYDSHTLIEHNLFDGHRHSISGFGIDTNSYEARYNVVGPISYGHSFDMHNWDENGGSKSVAGDHINVHHNTFMFTQETVAEGSEGDEAVKIRGVSQNQSYIENNWFRHTTKPTPPGAEYTAYHQERTSGSFQNVTIGNNHFGESAPSTYDIGAPRPADADHLVERILRDVSEDDDIS